MFTKCWDWFSDTSLKLLSEFSSNRRFEEVIKANIIKLATNKLVNIAMRLEIRSLAMPEVMKM